jgi:hypothetical protein
VGKQCSWMLVAFAWQSSCFGSREIITNGSTSHIHSRAPLSRRLARWLRHFPVSLTKQSSGEFPLCSLRLFFSSLSPFLCQLCAGSLQSRSLQIFYQH